MCTYIVFIQKIGLFCRTAADAVAYNNNNITSLYARVLPSYRNEIRRCAVYATRSISLRAQHLCGGFGCFLYTSGFHAWRPSPPVPFRQRFAPGIKLKNHALVFVYTTNISISNVNFFKYSIAAQRCEYERAYGRGVWRELLRPLLCATAVYTTHELPMLLNVFLSPPPPPQPRYKPGRRHEQRDVIQYIYIYKYTRNRSRRYYTHTHITTTQQWCCGWWRRGAKTHRSRHVPPVPRGPIHVFSAYTWRISPAIWLHARENGISHGKQIAAVAVRSSERNEYFVYTLVICARARRKP